VSRLNSTVVKVGGSLLDWPPLPCRLKAFLNKLSISVPSQRIVLVAGGGTAVDLVRALDRIHQLGDERAHHLALEALDLTANILAQLVAGSTLVDRLGALEGAWCSGLVPILAPHRCISELDGIGRGPLPANWSVTSDSIAASIADALGADCLILLKSASLPADATRADAVRLGVVDPMFPAIAQSLARVEYLNLRERSLAPRIFPP
jgi:aspartokinase-like uncharacterized kinase